MSVGDRIKVMTSHLFQAEGNVAIYHVSVDSNNKYVVDSEGVCSPSVVGGVKLGSTGTIDGHAVRARRTSLKGFEKVTTMGGNDTILLYPIWFDHYKQVGWLPIDHFQIVSGQTT